MNYIIHVYCGPFLSIASILSIKSFFYATGLYNIQYSNYSYNFLDFRSYFLLNDSIIQMDCKTNILFVGLNCRLESPILNAKFRKSYLDNEDFTCYSLGLALHHTTYPILNLGNSINSIYHFIEGRLSSILYMIDDFFAPNFSLNNLNLNIFIGSSILRRFDNIFIIKIFYKFLLDRGINLSNLHIVNAKPGVISYNEAGLISHNNIYSSNFLVLPKLIFYCGLDAYTPLNGKNNCIITISSHLSDKKSNIILPIPVYTEEDSYYINLEGSYEKAQQLFNHLKILSLFGKYLEY